MLYQLLLTVHIISATVLFGTGLGTAFHGLMAHRSVRTGSSPRRP